jgi:nucleoside-diphosphate-sugar epimerase
MHTILGAGGAIGTELVKELAQNVRLVGRNPLRVPGSTQFVSADISQLDQTIQAVLGSSVVYLLIGLKYDTKLWDELWPRIMRNAIEACKIAKAKLIFFDNVYMYGRVTGPMTEDCPFNPCSKKGEIRARIATTLLDEIKAGRITAMIVRSADFYGPRARTSVANMLVFDKYAKGSKAACLVSGSLPHSYTFTPDAARSLAVLANAESAWNQTWHALTAPDPPSGEKFVRMVAKEFGVEPRCQVLSHTMIKLAGLFQSDIRESYEMLYQNDSAYIFDSTKLSKALGLHATPYVDGVRLTAAACKT